MTWLKSLHFEVENLIVPWNQIELATDWFNTEPDQNWNFIFTEPIVEEIEETKIAPVSIFHNQGDSNTKTEEFSN